MKQPQRVYRNNIWCRDKRYEFDRRALTDADFETIARLGAVDIAKKQIPPVPVRGLLAIASSIEEMPVAAKATTDTIVKYLNATIRHHGAGIPTVICMLAVETNGNYPPIDSKFVAGLRSKRVISVTEQKQLNGKSLRPFAEVYVGKVLPAWSASRKTRTAEQADKYWGRGGKDPA